jgi:hypothetical protein
MYNIERLNTTDPKSFWDEIKRLGPTKSSQVIPMETYGPDGKIITDKKAVLDRWVEDYSSLYLGNHDAEDDFIKDIKWQNERAEFGFVDPLFVDDNAALLNKDITEEEVRIVVMNSKNNKATGADKIPYEILKSPGIISVLRHLFQLCLDYHMTPSPWNGSLVQPIPKSKDSDPRIPLNYRGISLVTVVAKLFSSLLNKRLVTFLEDGPKLSEEQCGFRPRRGCEDHIFTLHSLIQRQILQRKDLYVAFMDLRKAFDLVNRDIMLHKIREIGVGGKFYFAIKALYSDTWSQIRLNDVLTDRFPTTSGVRQGDALSPTLFIILMNDLSRELNSLPCSVQINSSQVNHLMYADDVALVAENAEDLQSLVTTMYEWCNRWHLSINSEKSKVVHFRRKRTDRRPRRIEVAGSTLEYVCAFKYLGVIFDEHLTYNEHASALAGSASRALGAIIAKYKGNKYMPFKVYEKLYTAGVTPILDYGANVSGMHTWSELESVQTKASRVFIGVHKFAPHAAIEGDTGWIPCETRHKLIRLKFWNKALALPGHRLPKQALLEMYHNPPIPQDENKTWISNCRTTLVECDQQNVYDDLTPCSIEKCADKLKSIDEKRWIDAIAAKPKLRTYVQIKKSKETEEYLKINLNPSERSIIAQMRFGILPIAIETGRFTRTPLEQRLCPVCRSEVETEVHFIFECPAYGEIRDASFGQIDPSKPSNVYLYELCSDHPRVFAKFLKRCMEKRKSYFILSTPP